jgi:hypothetical protein
MMGCMMVLGEVVGFVVSGSRFPEEDVPELLV